MTDENTNLETPSPTWFIDEGIPGTGNRPTWLPEKFKTAADMAKSHSELEKRFGTVPDKYDFSKSKFIDPDYVPFQEFQQVAKDKRVPQEVIDKMVDSLDKYMSEFSIDPKEELTRLGENAKERVVILDNWAKANLSKDSYEALTSQLTNAESIKALEELRGKMMSGTPQIPGNSGTVVNAASLDDLKMELCNNLEKYKTDDAYRKDFQRRIEIASKNSTAYVDKVGS